MASSLDEKQKFTFFGLFLVMDRNLDIYWLTIQIIIVDVYDVDTHISVPIMYLEIEIEYVESTI